MIYCCFIVIIVLDILLSASNCYALSHRRYSIRRKLVDNDNIETILESALSKGFNTSNLIYQRFEFYNPMRIQFFLASANMPSQAWDILKYKVATKTLLGNSTFLMIFGGSSVTAGHDNYYSQAYPFVVERRLRPIFEELGIDFQVHNIAQGANNCRPSNYCYEGMGGSHPDWIGWEQSYNCGKAKDVFEIVARIATINNALLYFSASGAFVPDKCAPSKDPLYWTSEEWTPEKAGIVSEFRPSPQNVSDFRLTLDKWFKDGDSVARFVAPLGGWYDNSAPHGFSVWGRSNICYNEFQNQTFSCSGYDVKGDCYERGGPHWMVYETSRFGQAGGRGKSWHPPAGMHLVRGESIVYNYVMAIIDAIYMMKNDLKTASRQDLLKEYQSRLKKLQSLSLPPNPAYCSSEECGTRPLCYTNYEPHFNPEYRLTNLVIGNHTGWQYVNHLPDVDTKTYGFKDFRPCYEAKGSKLEISFKVSVPKNNGIIIVCGYSSKESLKHADFYLHVNSTILDELERNPSLNISQIEIPQEGRVMISARKYHGDECTRLKNIPKGRHLLTVSTDPKHPDHLSSVSHVITFE